VALFHAALFPKSLGPLRGHQGACGPCGFGSFVDESTYDSGFQYSEPWESAHGGPHLSALTIPVSTSVDLVERATRFGCWPTAASPKGELIDLNPRSSVGFVAGTAWEGYGGLSGCGQGT